MLPITCTTAISAIDMYVCVNVSCTYTPAYPFTFTYLYGHTFYTVFMCNRYLIGFLIIRWYLIVWLLLFHYDSYLLYFIIYIILALMHFIRIKRFLCSIFTSMSKTLKRVPLKQRITWWQVDSLPLSLKNTYRRKKRPVNYIFCTDFDIFT